jgi:hypothetical protein
VNATFRFHTYTAAALRHTASGAFGLAIVFMCHALRAANVLGVEFRKLAMRVLNWLRAAERAVRS